MSREVATGSDDYLTAVLGEIAEARGLPNEHYVADAEYEEEKRAVLFGTWAGIGFGKDAPEPGDVTPIDFLGAPLVLARDKGGRLRVFQNVCRHRGMILVNAPRTRQGLIRCPYHSWCYGLDGALTATPHVGGPDVNAHPAMDRESLGLVEVRSHVWRDVVFVNMSGDAPDFVQDKAELLERWAEFERPLYHGGSESSFTLDVATNWKLAVENYCEAYHLPWVHPGLNQYSKLEDHYDIEAATFSGQGSHVYQQLKGDGDAVFPDFDGLASKWDTAAEYIAVYPNVLMGVHRDHAYAILLEAKSVDRTVERVEIYYADPTATSAAFQPMRTFNAERWRNIFEEDIGVVEGMQKGRSAPLFDGGRFSPAMDRPTHAFHRWIAGRILEGRRT